MATTPPTHTKASRNGNGGKGAARSRDAAGSPVSPEIRAPRKPRVVQPFGHLRLAPIGLSAAARAESCGLLNEILADTTILYALYKKHHWLVAGPTFYQLHLLFDKHAEEQAELIDLLAERVQSLGGVAVGDPRHAAELTSIPRPPDGAEEVTGMLDRLLDAHESVMERVREAIRRTDENEDWGTNDLLMGDVLRRHELQAWFVSSHLVDVPIVAPAS
jgi:starvation-inducible DNA-binding protein